MSSETSLHGGAFLALFILAGVAGCGQEACEVLIVNEVSSVGVAQKYQDDLMEKVNLAESSAIEVGGSWMVVVVNAKPRPSNARNDGPWVDYKVNSPSREGAKERCSLAFDGCVSQILDKLPRECRVAR